MTAYTITGVLLTREKRIRNFDLLTQERLKEVLDYNPETGLFTRKVSTKGRFGRVGTTAGTITEHGYRAICIDKKLHYAHRLAWLYETGIYPNTEIDHINRDRLDNRISNLRPASSSENGYNNPKRKHNKSGYKCVHWSKVGKKWLVQVGAEGKRHNLGYYDDVNIAAVIANVGMLKYQGKFAVLNEVVM